VDRSEAGAATRVWISARTGAGIEPLLAVISEHLQSDIVRATVRLGVAQAGLRALLYQTARIITERPLQGGGWEIDVEIAQRDYDVLRNRPERVEFSPLKGR